ncbi:MAG: hypothetical protein AAF645_01015 [Myxococcota bacterium]
MKRLCVLSIGFVLAIVVAPVADAQQGGRHVGGLRPEVHGNLGLHGFLGVGVELEFAIAPQGMLSRVDDEVTLVPGFDFLFAEFEDDDNDDTEVAFVPHFAGRWNFYLSSKWSFFPELGIAFMVATNDRDGDDRFYRGGRARNVYVDPLVAFGARWHGADRFAVTMRIGYPFGAQVGLAF